MPTVLIVTASPLDQVRLRLGAEVRDIRNALQRSSHRDDWTIESNEATTVDDLRRALLDYDPAIVHFAGHGGGSEGLCFENSEGKTHSTDAKPLTRLFHQFKDNLKCVVLNACYSDEQANVIIQEVDYVIGMRAAVDDDTARGFAVAFYDAVFADRDFFTAFELACTALDLNSLPDADVPIFMTSPHIGKRTLTYNAIIPEVEQVLYAYYNTPYADRCPFTTTGDSLYPQLMNYYGEQFHRSVDSVRVLSIDQMDTEHWRAEIDVRPTWEDTLVYLHIHNHSILIEWEATVGLWSMPVRMYLAMASREPVTARVYAELDNIYMYYFWDKKQHFQSVMLYTRVEVILYGYVQRDTPVYNDIMAILSDGNKHSITIEIVNAINESNAPLIQKLLSSTWLYSATNDTI